MATHTPMALEADEQTEKRARWETFAFVLPTAGKVNVANHSHGDEHVADHTYTVTVNEGGPIECTCPAFEYHCRPGEACKHITAVTETDAVLQAALASLEADGDEAPDVCTDGGQLVADGRERDGAGDAPRLDADARHAVRSVVTVLLAPRLDHHLDDFGAFAAVLATAAETTVRAVDE